MHKMNLYDKEILSQEGIKGFTSVNIFTTGGSDEVWGNAEKECNPLTYSPLDASIDYSNANIRNNNKKPDTNNEYSISLPTVNINDYKKSLKNSLHIKTDYPSSCSWIGMGIGWDSWQGKDLTNILDGAAIEFMARVDNEHIYTIPIVFILEDYSANQCYATASYLGIEGGRVTNKWTKVTIPLPTFSYNKNNIDLTNIKQLLLQCYNKVDIYLDDIKIVPHNHQYKRIASQLTVNDTTYPINVFEEELYSSWGIDNTHCDNFKVKYHQDNGGKYINVDLTNSCDWKEFAISWNNWLYTDMSSNINGVKFEFDLKIEVFTSATVTFDDYNGAKMSINLLDHLQKTDHEEWQTISIPMKKFPVRSSKIDLKKIKSVVFAFDDNTKLKIDNIKLTK